VQTHEIDTRAESPGVSRSATANKPLQFVPREQIPQPQPRKRNRLRPVRIETEQPRPDQAV
jgi:hypothetical protein